MADGLLNSITHRRNLILHCCVLVIVSGFFYGKFFLNLFKMLFLIMHIYSHIFSCKFKYTYTINIHVMFEIQVIEANSSFMAKYNLN